MTQQMTSALRNRIGGGLLAATFAFLVVAIIVAQTAKDGAPRADPDNVQQVARGKQIYASSCAACHGVRLEGQPEWRSKLPSGRMPAPPHDKSGHTWHHPDPVLFGITKHGLIPGKYAPPGYQSDMPAYGGALSDEDIWAVLAYIKSSWPQEIRKSQRELTLQQGRR